MNESHETRWCPRCRRFRPKAEMYNTPTLPIKSWCESCMTKIYPLSVQFDRVGKLQKPIKVRTEKYFRVEQKAEPAIPPLSFTDLCSCSVCQRDRECAV